MKDGFSISRVAKLAGVGVETIRFYEREGILPEPPRTQAGYRVYGADAAPRIRFVKRAQELGFSLKEIAGLLALRVKPRTDCSGVKKRAEAKLEEIDDKIRDLKRMRKVLEDVTRACVANRPIEDCPILKSFEGK